jgi:hypothetical protein
MVRKNDNYLLGRRKNEWVSSCVIMEETYPGCGAVGSIPRIAILWCCGVRQVT